MPSVMLNPATVPARNIPAMERRSIGPYLRWARGCCLFASLFGLLGIIGWLNDSPILAQLNRNSVLIAPRAALAFWLLGMAVYLHLRKPSNLLGRGIVILTGAFVFWMGSANNYEFPKIYSLLEPILLKNLNIWEFIYRDRMEPLVAYTLFILGPSAILCPFIHRLPSALRDLMGATSLLVVGVHSMLLLGFLYGTPLSYPIGYKPPSLPSAAACLFMGLAFLGAVGPRHFPLFLFAGPSIRARLLRTFLPVGIISVVIYGLLSRTVFGPLNPALSSLLGIFLSTSIIAFLILRTADVVSRQIERSVRESEERFSILVESIKDYAMIMLDPEGYIVTWNTGAERFTGYRGAEIIGEHFSCFYPPDDGEENQPWKDLATTKARGSLEKHGWRLRKDGTRFWADVILTAVYDDNGSSRGFSEVTRDVTERRKSDDELKQKNDLILMLQRISAAANEAFRVEDAFQMTLDLVCRQMDWPVGHGLTLNLETNVLEPGIWRINDESAFKLFKEETTRLNWKIGDGLPGRVFATGKLAWSTDLKNDLVRNRADAAIASGLKSAYAFPVFLGTEVVAVLEFFSTRDIQPEAGFLIVMTQVGYQLGQVVERQRVEQKMTDSIQEKELLLKEIHHRVKNNLQIITSLLRLQSEGIQDPNVLDMFKESQSRVRSMAMVHEYLYKSPDLASVKFSEYVENIVSGLFRSYGIQKEVVNLYLDVDETPLNLNTAIPAGLIVTELVANVLKHAFPENRKGNLWLSFHSADPDVYNLTVKDDGIGFKNGVQLETAESLGLRLVKTLVTQLRGTVDIRKDNGMEFKITLKKQN
jgi:PAS domain S-box-containing protein